LNTKSEMTPLEMAELLQEFTVKIENDRDLHPKEYLDKDVEVLYHIAHKHYTVDSYEEAEPLFMRLVMARPTNSAFWKGLASTFQMLKKYREALAAWGMCALLHPDDLSNHLFGAECLINLELEEDAKKALEYVGSLITEGHPNFKKYNKLTLIVKGEAFGDS
jgi:predicted Zn-dependent protease